jgi:uncharacterized protein HemX
MARNRKSQSAATRFGPALKACLLCVLIGGSGVGYVWQKEQIAKLGRQVTRRESALQSAEGTNERLRKQLANMRSPQFLEQHIKELGLSVPQQAQIMRLNEPVPPSTHRDSVQQYAARNDRAFAHP